MKRVLSLAVLAGVVLAVVGCGPGRGEKLADKTNEIMCAKIDKGEIKSEAELPLAQLTAMEEAMTALGLKKEDKITQGDQKKMEEKFEKYKGEWKERLKKKLGK
ncbi:MAG: hypothetical protein HYY17_14370 [Planctomycetes bacterium]|nr:hypothetical protein [Planctomycetota bacterium]